jgi:hypothetical protein
VIKETMRIYPPVPVTIRRSLRNGKEQTLPAGEAVLVLCTNDNGAAVRRAAPAARRWGRPCRSAITRSVDGGSPGER